MEFCSTLPVKVKSSNGNKVIETYAFLDTGSTGTFCSEKLIDMLHIEGPKAKINLRTMGQAKAVKSSIIDKLEVSGFYGEYYYLLPSVCTQKVVPVSTGNIISERELRKWCYLWDVKMPHISTEAVASIIKQAHAYYCRCKTQYVVK